MNNSRVGWDELTLFLCEGQLKLMCFALAYGLDWEGSQLAGLLAGTALLDLLWSPQKLLARGTWSRCVQI